MKGSAAEDDPKRDGYKIVDKAGVVQLDEKNTK